MKKNLLIQAVLTATIMVASSSLAFADEVYRLKQGENLWTVAKKFNVSVKALERANHIDESDILQINQKIVVPSNGLSRKNYYKSSTSQGSYGTATVTGKVVNVRSGARTDAEILKVVKSGTKVVVLAKLNGWYKVKLASGNIGWIKSDYVGHGNASTNTSRGTYGRLIDNAFKFIGTPYVYGGTSRSGFDCSGFVQTVFRSGGLELPRTSQEQFRVGRRVEYSELQSGDLVFFNTTGQGVSHVGIYLGNGRFIHSSSSYKHHGVTVTSLEGYYRQRFVGARRVF